MPRHDGQASGDHEPRCSSALFGDDLESHDARALLSFLLRVDGLKEVTRRNSIADGSRRERTAEHCWHVAMGCLLFSRYAAEHINVERCVTLAVMHDLPELTVGDTFVYGSGEAGRRSRELEAISGLMEYLPEHEADLLEQAWRDYEFADTAEGRYVLAIDVLLPIFLNLETGRQSSWHIYKVKAAAVRQRIDRVRATIPELAAIADLAVDTAVAEGFLS
jgi:putative hydrolases of HD superfamily